MCVGGHAFDVYESTRTNRRVRVELFFCFVKGKRVAVYHQYFAVRPALSALSQPPRLSSTGVFSRIFHRATGYGVALLFSLLRELDQEIDAEP